MEIRCKKVILLRFGPTAFVKVLWERGFFETSRKIDDVRAEMEKERFHFDRHPVYMSLIRASFLTIRDGGFIEKYPPEPRLKDGGDVSSFDSHTFHPKIVAACKSRFKSKHYNDAIFAAFKEVEIYVKKKSGIESRDGKALMMHVFDSNNPKLKINKMENRNDKNEQEGYRYIFAGAMIGIKNPKSHGNIIQKDPKRTLQLLNLANLLLKIVDISVRTK